MNSNELQDLGGEYISYDKWECFQAGMYNQQYTQRHVSNAIYCLANAGILEKYMKEAVIKYPNSARHHLTKYNSNRRSWLGWVACFIAFGCPDYATREAWSMITDRQRMSANDVADRIILQYDMLQNPQKDLFYHAQN